MRSKILNREELLELLSCYSTMLNIQPQVRYENRVCVGMIGFPNVGKSSVINTLLGVGALKASYDLITITSTDQYFAQQRKDKYLNEISNYLLNNYGTI